jgi:hypothetical protein
MDVEHHRQRGEVHEIGAARVEHLTAETALTVDAGEHRQHRGRIGAQHDDRVVAGPSVAERVKPRLVWRFRFQQGDYTVLPIGSFEDVKTVMNRLRRESIIPLGCDNSHARELATGL